MLIVEDNDKNHPLEPGDCNCHGILRPNFVEDLKRACLPTIHRPYVLAAQSDVPCQEQREVKYLNVPVRFSKCSNFATSAGQWGFAESFKPIWLQS
jgi:hypothetical protein